MTVRDALKRATRTSHDAAEARLHVDGAFASLDGYIRFLKAMRRAHAGLGLDAARALGVEATGRELILIDRLDADLSESSDRASSPGADDPSTTAFSEDFAWGVAYALNGSAIGASIILKSGMVRDDWPTNYLRAQASGARDGLARRFFDALDARKPELREAASGAHAVFNLIIGGFPNARSDAGERA